MQLSGTTLRLVLCALASTALPTTAVSFRGPAAVNASSAPATAAVAPAAATPAPKRTKLDVGFASFEANVTEEVAKSIKDRVTGNGWTEEMRTNLVANVTSSLKAALDEELHPLKVSIGQTWMAFPQDEDKAKYVDTLKSGFESVLDRTANSIISHAKLSAQRIATTDTKGDSAALVAKAEESLVRGLVDDHCYDNEATHKKSGNASGNATGSQKFCIPSVVHSFLRRLNDTQNLISMTMKFETKTLTMVQEAKKQDHEAASVRR